MSSVEGNFIPILGGLLILAGYGFFMIFYRLHKGGERVRGWKRRLTENKATFKKNTKEALTLLKEQGSPDTYFKSKLPKIEGLQQWIQHAGLNISPAIFIAVCWAIGLSLFFVLFFLHINFLLAALLGATISFLLPWLFIMFFTSRRRKEFLEEFPIALDVIRRALRAGYAVDRALEMVAEQQKSPIGKIFHTLSDKMRLGETPEAVLGEMANRLGIDEFRMLSIVIILQRETGGSLAEATDNFAKIIRARESLRKRVKALSAEVRVTAMILASLPFFILGAVFITSPQYLDPLFYTERGHTLLLVGGCMLFTGIGIMIRMAYKDIY